MMNDADLPGHDVPETSPAPSDGMELGWVKNWRKKLHSDLWQNKNANRIFEFLLLSATHKPIKRGVGSVVLNLKPGDYISSIRKIAEKCDLTVKEVRVALRFLTRTCRVATQNVTQGKAHYATVISIVNWGRYQPVTDTKGTAEGTAKGTRRAHEGHNNKKLRSEEEHLLHSAPAEEPPSDRGNGKPPLKTRDRKPKEYPQAVLDVYQAYCENIVAVPAKKADALRNIAARIKEGYTPKQLIEAVERYFVERQGNPDALPYHANNFFGQKAYFLGYLPDPGAGDPEAAHA